MRYIEHPESLLEKEYYFDETLGQSLKDHIDQIKQDFPGMKVQTRRDRDGFAIIKTSYKQEYKYNMEEILSADLEENRRVLLETFERLAETDFE